MSFIDTVVNCFVNKRPISELKEIFEKSKYTFQDLMKISNEVCEKCINKQECKSGDYDEHIDILINTIVTFEI